MNVPIIVLAAGASVRMGQSKQLLKIDDTSLLRHSVVTAIESETGVVIVVLGANEAEHRKELRNLNVIILNHPEWGKGMGSSLKVGLQHVRQFISDAEGVIVMVCDQPLLKTEHLKNLRNSFEKERKKITASKYGEATGVPALFSNSLFGELMLLPDHEGARKIIQQHPSETSVIDFPEGEKDIDTSEDWKAFLKSDQ